MPASVPDTTSTTSTARPPYDRSTSSAGAGRQLSRPGEVEVEGQEKKMHTE
jgi:hypothetical protein